MFSSSVSSVFCDMKLEDQVMAELRRAGTYHSIPRPPGSCRWVLYSLTGVLTGICLSSTSTFSGRFASHTFFSPDVWRGFATSV